MNTVTRLSSRPRHRSPRLAPRPVRWIRRRIRWVIGVPGLLFLLVIAGLAGYVASVPLPREPRTPQASVIYYRDGQTVLARVGVENRTDVPLSRVPAGVQHAVLAAEDRGFYHHYGLSTRGIVRALWTNIAKDSGEGASTITQQYTRNAYLSQQRTASRKAKEAALSVKVEQRYSKDEILERYLNTIYLGRGASGIEAASHAFFGVTVDRLTIEQGAVLAAQAKSPSGFDPAINPTAARDRWRWVLNSMVGAGWLDQKRAAAMSYPRVSPRSPTRAADSGPLGLVVDQVEAELEKKGIPPQTVRTNGLRIITTLDQKAQTAAVSAIETQLRGQPAELRAALVALDPQTGGVRAYYGGDQGRGFYDDAAAPRPPASTFKPIVLAEGLRQGISFQSRWDGTSPRLFADRMGVPLLNQSGIQCPDCPLDQAMVQSLNTPYYALAERVGAANVRELAVRLGIPDRYHGSPSLVDAKGAPRPGKTRAEISLGVYPVAPADVASVYATFAAGGVHATRHVVQSVADGLGAELLTEDPTATRVLSAAVAADVTTVLAKVVSADGAVSGHPAAAKTGTQQYADTSDNQDAWTAGYTPRLAAAVWLGRAEPGPIRTVDGKPIQGDGIPYQVWKTFLASALADEPPNFLPAPANIGSPDTGDAQSAADAPGSAPRAKRPSPAQSPSASGPGTSRGSTPPSGKEPSGKATGSAESQPDKSSPAKDGRWRQTPNQD